MHEITARKITPAAFESVRCIEGYDRIRREFPDYLSDESKLSAEPFDYLFFPADEAQLAAVLQGLAARRIRLTLAGARTGLSGGCVPREGALVSLEHLNRVEAVFRDDPADEWRITAQCGLSLRQLDAQVSAKRFPDLAAGADRHQRARLECLRQDPGRYFYPPDPTELSASLGGTVATNASGARTFRYGSTRAWVRGLRLMLPGGELLSIPRGRYFASAGGEFVLYDSAGGAASVRLPAYRMPATKNTCGFFVAPQMDLIDLVIGSEGSFGIITAVTVALLQRSPVISLVQFLNSDEQAVELAAALREDKRIRLEFLEFYSQTALELLRARQQRDPHGVAVPPIPAAAGAALFFELSSDPAAPGPEFDALREILTDAGVSLKDSWTAHEKRERERLKTFRHILPETVNAVIAERKARHPGLHKLGTDLAVPDEGLRPMWRIYRDGLEAAHLQWVAFGHIGNNHLHINILPRDMADLEKGLALYRRFARCAVDFGGSVSAEHGIGKLKTRFLEMMYRPEDVQAMRAVRKAFDPQCMLNPGNLFGD